MSGQQGKGQQPIPENEVKQTSSVSASYALQAMQKAYELRQAANAAGDPDAREEILAKAVNKEIEAESFGKAAKYTRGGTFQDRCLGRWSCVDRDGLAGRRNWECIWGHAWSILGFGTDG